MLPSKRKRMLLMILRKAEEKQQRLLKKEKNMLPKQVNTNSQRKTVISICKIEIAQRSKIGSKTDRCRVPNS